MDQQFDVQRMKFVQGNDYCRTRATREGYMESFNDYHKAPTEADNTEDNEIRQLEG